MKLGRIILFTALFFGAKAVFKNRQAGTSSAGGSASGKTNDTMTPEEIAELKKRLERQKLLQNICKNINIAKENERLNGLSGADEEATKEEVESFTVS